MEREPYEISLLKWVQLAVAPLGIAPNKVRFFSSRPNSGKLDKPFVTLQVVSNDPTADSMRETTDEVLGSGYTQEILIEEEGLLRVTAYGYRHNEILRKIEDSIAKPSVQLHFDSERVHVTRFGGSGSSYFFESLATQLEPRGDRVFVFRRFREEQDEVSVIETLETSPTYEG